VLVVAGVFCFMLARHIARPIERLRAAAGQIADQQLETRVDSRVLNRRDELADLGRDFDRMAERIETLVTAQRRLLADVSHALRSPLARLNVALGLARRQGDPAAAVHLDRIEGETERLNTLIGQLLTMARVEGGLDLERQSVFDLGHVVAEVAADADMKRATVSARCVSISGANAPSRARARWFAGAVENVVRNAVRHTADHTTVEIAMDLPAGCRQAARRSSKCGITDQGAGDAVANLFTPFHRVVNGDTDTSNRTGPGARDYESGRSKSWRHGNSRERAWRRVRGDA
jgi:two-component system sensor histidine kinase CpxA